jgi:hypothetical protein
MPIFRVGDKLHYYAHVPKCGGSSVEAYLKARFGTLGFLDTRFLDLPEPQRWTKSSPQHLPYSALSKLIPAGWIASSFAVVRHPVKRLVSAFQYQVEVEGTVAALWSIDEFFDDWLKNAKDDPFRYDNHLRPQADIVPEGATVFRLEDGLGAIVPHLDTLAGNSDGPRAIPKENVRKKGMAPDAERMKLSPETMTRIADYYAEDFRRFGYDAGPAPVHSIAAPKSKGFMNRLSGALGGRRT